MEISPSKKIIVDKEDIVTVTCRYNLHCGAILFDKGDADNPRKELKRPIRNNTINELTWKSHPIQKANGGQYVCRLKTCSQSANDYKNICFEIDVKSKL